MNPKIHPTYEFRNFSNYRLSNFQNDLLTKITKNMLRVNFGIHRKILRITLIMIFS